MKAAIQEEWEDLRLKDYLNYIKSMPKRVISALGGYTK
jgi:hypothetical protein